MIDKEEDLWYRGEDLMQPQQQLLYQKIQEAIKQEQGEIVCILSLLETNSQWYQQLQKEQERLGANKETQEQLEAIKNQIAIIHTTQSELLLSLHPLFDNLFDHIASETQGGRGYNEALRDRVWQDLIEIFRKEPGAIDVSRDSYRSSTLSKHTKKKGNTDNHPKKAKVRIPKDHRLLTEETYPQFQATMWTHIDNTVTIYRQKFLRDSEDNEQIQRLLEHYFLFIFIQALVQSQVIFDITKPKSNDFFQAVIDDAITYVQQKYGITLSVSSEIIKKKFFVTQDNEEKMSKPLEYVYTNCMEEDILGWEKYLNALFFATKQTSVDKIRREIQAERDQSVEKMNKIWELLNPLYHIAKEKKSKILTTLEILRHYQAEDNLVTDIIVQLETTLQKTDEDMKEYMVFEENPVLPTNSDSPTKLQQQQLKHYQVPPQYRKMFGLVINRLNHYYQIKTNLCTRAKKINEEAFNRLLQSEQKWTDIKKFIDDLITEQKLAQTFEQKWNDKTQEKYQKIQGLCHGTTNVHKLSQKKKKKNAQDFKGQMGLHF